MRTLTKAKFDSGRAVLSVARHGYNVFRAHANFSVLMYRRMYERSLALKDDGNDSSMVCVAPKSERFLCGTNVLTRLL